MNQNVSDYDKYNYNYEEYWSNKEVNRNYENEAEKTALLKLLPKKDTLPSGADSWFCDLGAGFGRLFDVYGEFYQNIVLVDYSVENMRKAKDRILKSIPKDPKDPNSLKAPNIYFIAANAYGLPFKNETIDCLMSVRMMHHLENSEKAIGQIRNVLKSKGSLILEYANKRHFVEVIRAMMGKSEMKPFTLQPYHRGEDLFFNFHPKYIRNLLASSFRVKKTVSVSNLRSGLLKKILPTKVMLFIDKIFHPVFNLFKFGPSIFVLAEKKVHPAPDGQKIAHTIANILQCPRCGSYELIFLKNEIRCKECEKHYPIIDGVYDFRV